MSILNRQLAFGAGLSFIYFIIVTVIYFLIFPLSNWSLLWDRDVFGLPAVLFIPLISIVIGLISGLVSGLFWQKQMKNLNDALYDLEEGRQVSKLPESSIEMNAIYKRVIKIQKQIQEHAKLSQKLATEKAEEQDKRIQEIVSQERNRLARELHDSVSQQLFAASMLMSAINDSKPPENNRETTQLKLVEEMIHQSQLEMRALLLHLRPVPLKGKSLHEGIRELLTELMQKVPFQIEWKLEPIQMDKGIEDHLFRILQESVSNTLRHSKADSLEVLLIERENFIILRIVDDGVGFDVEEAKAGSYGLQNMHERAIEIGGTFKMVSVKNKGTRLEVKIPIMKTEDEGHD